MGVKEFINERIQDPRGAVTGFLVDYCNADKRAQAVEEYEFWMNVIQTINEQNTSKSDQETDQETSTGV